MKKRALLSMTAAAVIVAASLVFAEVEVCGDKICVGRGDVLSRYTHDFSPTLFNEKGGSATFDIALSQAYEQDCYFTGGQPNAGSFAGVRTGTASVEGTDSSPLVKRNPNGVIIGYELTPPPFDSDENDIEWDGSGSGNPGGSGCPGGPSVSHPNSPPRATGPVEIESIKVTIDGLTRTIYPS